MNSTRRGFLGLLSGGAVAGPGALKKAMASASANAAANAVGSIGCGSPVGAEPESEATWRARNILQTIRNRSGPAIQYPHHHQYPDIDALKSISNCHRVRMTRERALDEELSQQVQHFIRESKLNWVGLTEERLLSIVKQAAGE